MQKVKLVGNISKFGETWETDCNNIRDIFKLIECQTPGFRQHLLDAADAGVGYEIRRGKEFLEREEELLLSLNNEDINQVHSHYNYPYPDLDSESNYLQTG